MMMGRREMEGPIRRTLAETVGLRGRTMFEIVLALVETNARRLVADAR